MNSLIVRFARLARFLYAKDNRAGEKLINAITSYVITGSCNTNASEDSVCGGKCSTCRGSSEIEEIE